MRNVKLIATWANYVKGSWAAIEDKVAENLITKGIAIDPTRPKPEPVVSPCLVEDTTNNTPTTFAKIALKSTKAAKKRAGQNAKRKPKGRRI